MNSKKVTFDSLFNNIFSKWELANKDFTKYNTFWFFGVARFTNDWIVK